jgi:hypothetical protein|tara:strand:+ start:282 stop:644 length:363 start_codon:yes stop_codon:yes gene_type:complete
MIKKKINDITTDEWNSLEEQSKQKDLPGLSSNLHDYTFITESKPRTDNVNAPFHYNAGKIECIEGIEASMSSEAFKGYLKGNCQKYLWRFDYKGKAKEDLQKASWYLNKLISIVIIEEKK